MINLTIKTLDSQDHKFNVPDTFTILELKEHIAEKVNIAVVQQRLIFCGRVMSNETKLADIGIDGKVMHLVQKVPRLTTTTSGTSSSTTTNTNSRSGQNGGPGFRGWHTHDPTVVFGAIGIPSEFVHAGELPRLLSASANARSHGAGNRVSLAMDMIRRANEILNRLENPRTSGRSTANNVEQLPEGSQQTEETSRNVQPESPAQEPSLQESSSLPTQPESDSLNVSYEVDDTFPNTVVVTIDATHHMRMPQGLLRHMHSQMQAMNNNSNSTSQNVAEQTVEGEVTTIPEMVSSGSNNQHSTDQATGTGLPSSATSEPNLRNDRPNSESRSSAAINDRRRLRELIEQLNKLNARLQPFYALYCQYINEDPHFENIEGDNGSHRAQTVFNGVSEVMHFISHIYHAISDLRVAFNRPPPRSFQSRPCLLQGTILHTAHSVTTATTAAPPPAPSTQQPTSTQTTTTNQSIPSVRALRVDFLNPEGVGSETTNVSTSASTTETNTNMTVDPNTESNNTATEFPSETSHGVELMFDLTPGSFRIDSVEAAFVNPNASGSSQPTTISQPSSGGETSNNMSMPIDWMDQMIDVISSGVRRPFMPDQSLDWSIPTTSTRTPRVTPRTTDSSSTTNPPSQGLNRGRWDAISPRMDPFLPCSSHHFESNVRPMVLARRSTQGTDRSTSSGNSNNTDSSTPTSPNDVRPISVRRTGRPRTRYVQDTDGFLSGIHPILTWGRNHRNNTATTSASNNTQVTGQGTDIASGQIRIGGIENVFDTLEREVDFDRATRNVQPPSSSALEILASINPTNQSVRGPDEVFLMPIGDIPYFRSIEGRYILGDLFLLIARNWTLHDMLNLCTVELSTLVQHPISSISDALVDFVLDRIMLNLPPTNINIEAAANRIYLEVAPYINIFQCSVPTRTNIDVNASFRRCILQNLRGIVIYCVENRTGASNDIVSSLTIFAEGLLSLVVYCCNNRSVFRLSVGAVMQFLPFPTNLHRYIMDQVGLNVDHYWDNLTTFQMMSLSVVDFIVPFNSEFEGGQTSRVNNEEQSSNSILPSSDIANEPLPEVVIGSQEWHHGVPSEWVPVIARDSQRQRRQGTQPPYSDAYLSGMPNKRRKIVTSSKPQGPLSQIIAKNLEVAMGAAGVAVKKEVTTSVGADTAVQNAYTERIRTFGRSGLDMHPDFSPDRYPNASKFFYNRPN